MFGYRVPAPDEAMLISGAELRQRPVSGGDRSRRFHHAVLPKGSVPHVGDV